MRFDLDDLLAYTTVKTVRIRDRWLGILHYGAIVAIFLYIVVFTVILNRGYLYFESPVGSTRFAFRRPFANDVSDPRPPEDLSYCLQGGYPDSRTRLNRTDKCLGPDGSLLPPGTEMIYPNFDCIYYDEDDAVFPTAESNAIMLTTRITSRVYTLPNCSLYNYTCDYVALTPPVTNYIGDVERFTLLIDHAMRAPIAGKQRNGKFINGKLLRANGNEYPKSYFSPEEYIADPKLPNPLPTVLRLDTILNASGIASLDLPSDSDTNCSETYRYTGLVLLLFIRYNNRYSYNENRIQYTLQFQPLAETEFKVNQEIFLNPTYDDTTKTYNKDTSVTLNRHGVRIIAVILGEIGHFEFQTLLITLVSGMGLMAISTFIVDFLATTLLPNKRMYDAYKTQHTVDFSDWRAGRATPSPDVIYELQQRESASATEGSK